MILTPGATEIDISAIEAECLSAHDDRLSAPVEFSDRRSWEESLRYGAEEGVEMCEQGLSGTALRSMCKVDYTRVVEALDNHVKVRA